MYNSYRRHSSSNSTGVEIAILIGIFILGCMINSCSRSESRAERNMVYIQEGYCYDENTCIIYIESYTGRYGTNTAYSPYYDSEGHVCKYDVTTGEWIPVIN